MKKEFIEPKMQRIELNLKENIATSQTISSGGILFMVSETGCYVVSTGKKADELYIHQIFGSDCYVPGSGRAGKTVPVEKARQYFKH